MHINNEIGTMQPVEEIDRFVRRSRPSLAVGQLGLVC